MPRVLVLLCLLLTTTACVQRPRYITIDQLIPTLDDVTKETR